MRGDAAPRIYEQHVHDGLAELASEELQRRRWLGIGNEMSSFDEAVEQVYSDSGLTNALDTGEAEALLGKNATDALRTLEAAVKAVWDVRSDWSPAELIPSNEMRRVRSLATHALDALAASRS